jgi:hypothetical protein
MTTGGKAMTTKKSQPTSIRLSEDATQLRALLAQRLGVSEAAVLELAIRELAFKYQKEDFAMKRTTNPQEAAQAAQEDKIVKMPLTGRNWRVNGLSEGANGWVAMISHPDYANSKVVDVLENQEFVIYSQAEYRRMVDDLAGRLA